MKKPFSKMVCFIFVAVYLLVLVSCSNQQNDIQIYSFSGESDNISISNGVIFITKDLEKFIGGDLSFNSNLILNVKKSSARFYFIKDGVETTIQENMDIINGSYKGMEIQQDTGSSSSKDLFQGKDLELIEESLYFSLIGNFMNDKNFQYTIPLKVKRVH